MGELKQIHQRLSERQKAFARLVHEQVPPYRAYALAGYRPHESNPYRLSENERVKQYMCELEARTMERHQVTVDTLLTELEEARLNAKSAKQPSSEVSAIMGKAKLAGLLVDKQEIKDVSNMNMEELIQSVRDKLGDQAEIVLKALGLAPQAAQTNQSSSQTRQENKEGEKSGPATVASRNFRLVR
jgi:phage terminase small subunit